MVSATSTNTQCLMDDLLDDDPSTITVDAEGQCGDRTAGDHEHGISEISKHSKHSKPPKGPTSPQRANMSLIPAFFGQTDSQCLSSMTTGDAAPSVDASILDEDNELVLTQIPRTNTPPIPDDGAAVNGVRGFQLSPFGPSACSQRRDGGDDHPIDQMERFPSDIGLSVNEQFVFDSNGDGHGDRDEDGDGGERGELVVNEQSTMSNLGSLCDISGDDAMNMEMEMDCEEDELLSVKPPERGSGHRVDASLTTLLDSANAFGDRPEAAKDFVDLSMSISPDEDRVASDHTLAPFGDSQDLLTPILARRRPKSAVNVSSNVTMIMPETPAHCPPLTPMVGPHKEMVLKQLNVYFETPEAERRSMPKPVEPLPPDIPGRSEYVERLNRMSVDELKRDMKRYGLKVGSKAMMKQRLEMAWDALHPNSPMLRRLDQHINATQKSGRVDGMELTERKRAGDGHCGQERRGNVPLSDIDEIFNMLLS